MSYTNRRDPGAPHIFTNEELNKFRTDCYRAGCLDTREKTLRLVREKIEGMRLGEHHAFDIDKILALFAPGGELDPEPIDISIKPQDIIDLADPEGGGE